MATVGKLIEERREAAIVGREAERAELAALLDADGPLVMFVSGVGGIGKSVRPLTDDPADDVDPVWSASSGASQ